MSNEIFIHTDKGYYIGGDIIYGTIFISINKPIEAKGILVELIGEEKVMWHYEHRENYTDNNGQQQTKVEIRHHKAHNHFFKDSFKLVEYPGSFPVGRFSYPFQYRLPANLPGTFYKKKGGRLPMKAAVGYKIKCVLQRPGIFTFDLKEKRHITIHERLDNLIQPQHLIKTAEVRTLCCIPRGPVRVECWMDKNSYVAGETVQAHVKVDNDSAVEVRHFTSKLIREISLYAHGNRHVIRTVICEQRYPGTPPHTNKESPVPLPLMGKRHRNVKPATNAKLLQCKYTMMIEMDIPMAPDVELYSPVVIYAPQSPAFMQWQPPVWIAQAQQQTVCAQLAVPPEIAIQFANPNFYAPPPQISIQVQLPNVQLSPPSYNPESKQTNEKTPLLL